MDLAFGMFDDFDYVLGIFEHVFGEGEIFFDDLLLVELHIT